MHEQSVPHGEDLERFAEICRRLYFEKHGDAAQQVDSILQRLPAAHRTAYARTMSAVRTAFHRSEEQRRRAEVEHLLSSTAPAEGLKAHLGISRESTSVKALRSPAARAYRRARVKEFVAAHCVKDMPGTHPFFRALWAALSMQAQGAAEARCIEWEVDVAVFAEAGGSPEWARDAVVLLKSVLGMSERVKKASYADSLRTSLMGSSAASETSSVAGEPVIAPVIFERATVTAAGLPAQQRKEPPPVPPHRGSLNARTRSGSDPFLDPTEKTARQHASAPPHLAASAVSPLASPASPASPISPSASVPLLSSTSPTTPDPRTPSSPVAHATPPAQYRLFTLPSYLTNPELLTLCALFPDFISTPSTRSAARLPSRKAAQTPARLEAGEAHDLDGADGTTVRVGHGTLRLGTARRDAGWRGTWWERIVSWLRRLFGLV
ncbi:hypothetical protein Rhopal_004000-T1 [Rhodotorula paludigena]|uniref:Uncharacterized protein n=1 Tax=Rhodotorula paludigena TaxID=86838 RepID=A0AAV5GN67_9BASI|nr:hypothetical protein Rhopal_004000-T1 [Rhodotorula paludigena]